MRTVITDILIAFAGFTTSFAPFGPSASAARSHPIASSSSPGYCCSPVGSRSPSVTGRSLTSYSITGPIAPAGVVTRYNSSSTGAPAPRPR
ncbi:MAG: hypothetical protein AAFR96_08280 [Planctomycetota bacterium]